MIAIYGALFAGLLNPVFTKNDSIPVKRIAAIEFTMGQELRLNPNFSLNDLRLLYPQSTLLSNFPQPDPTQSTVTSGLTLAVSTHILLGKKQPTSIVKTYLRAGIQLNTYSDYSISAQSSFSKNTDTLISPSSGNFLYVDTTINTYHSADLNANQLRVDAALLFHVNRKGRRISITSGLGLTAGAFYNTSTNIRKYQSANIQVWKYPNNKQSVYFDEVASPTQNAVEQFNDAPVITHLQAYVPIIVNFQFGSRSPNGFSSPYRMLFELSPGFALENNRTTGNTSFSTIQAKFSVVRSF
jgi:hypothetical protein